MVHMFHVRIYAMCLLSVAANTHLHGHIRNVPSAVQLMTSGSGFYCI